MVVPLRDAGLKINWINLNINILLLILIFFPGPVYSLIQHIAQDYLYKLVLYTQ